MISIIFTFSTCFSTKNGQKNFFWKKKIRNRFLIYIKLSESHIRPPKCAEPFATDLHTKKVISMYTKKKTPHIYNMGVCQKKPLLKRPIANRIFFHHCTCKRDTFHWLSMRLRVESRSVPRFFGSRRWVYLFLSTWAEKIFPYLAISMVIFW